MASAKGQFQEARILVVAYPPPPELKVLDSLPAGARIVGVGRTPDELSGVSPEELASVNVAVNCGVGASIGKRQHWEALWPALPNLRWIHSNAAGLEHFILPQMVEADLVITNAKGNFSHSLAEWCLAACLYFSKQLPRLQDQQKAKSWSPFDVEELRGRTMGIIGYGDIGQATATIARAFRMKIAALRRRSHLKNIREDAEGLQVYPPEALEELMRVSDYVVAALPHTPNTEKLVRRQAINAMKPNAVFINVGRGKTVDEEALIDALKERRIRGAALDVTYTEPLPADSPLWELDNVLLSPHSADRTAEFQFEAMGQFLDNVQRWVAGQPLFNLVDKREGY
eukprot:jgi/Botrbrau1/16322/Bobra.0066s0089.2